MAQATDYTENKVLEGLINGTQIELSSGKPYIGLLTSAPTDNTGGVECSGQGYARVRVGDPSQGSFVIGTAGSATNDDEFRWSDAENAWGSITHIALYDAASGGNMLIYGQLTSPVEIGTGDIFKVPPSGFTIQID